MFFLNYFYKTQSFKTEFQIELQRVRRELIVFSNMSQYTVYIYSYQQFHGQR